VELHVSGLLNCSQMRWIVVLEENISLAVWKLKVNDLVG
jgi:hypothetical protein